MLAYFIETSLMLLLTYLVGCAIGCSLRSLLAPRQSLATAAPEPRMAAAPAPVPRPVADPPAAPSVRATQPVNEAFRRADHGVQARNVPGPATAPATETRLQPPGAAPTPPAPVAARPQAPMAAEPVRPAPAPRVETSRAPSPAAASISAAAAAAAAAAVVQGRVREQTPASQRPAPPAAPPTPARGSEPGVTLPAAGAASGVSGVAVGVPVAPAEPAHKADDLKRIRGIGPEIEQALGRLGVRSYSQIAAWSASDVDAISKQLGLKGRIEHENWIEQAQVLKSGGQTAFSRRYDRNEIDTVPTPPQPAQASRPQTAAPGSSVPTPASPAAAAPARDTATSLTAGAVASAAAAAERARSAAAIAASAAAAAAAASRQPTSPSGSAQGGAPVAGRGFVPPPQSPPSSAATPQTSRVEQLKGLLTGAASTAPAAASPTSTPGSQSAPGAPARPSASGAPVATAPTSAPAPMAARPPAAAGLPLGDDLTRIRGIDAEMAAHLADGGITHYAQIATWSSSDADRFGAKLGLKVGRVQQEGWIEQARILSGLGPLPPAAPRQAGPTDMPVGLPPGHTRTSPPQEPAAPTRPAATAPAPAARSEAPALASVRSPALAQPSAPASSTATSSATRVIRSGVPDDLKRIKGIGVVLEKKLQSLGVIHYAQIAGWSQTDIDKMSEALDFKGRIERENWVEQARILATGGITDFARRVDRGEVETSKPRPVR